MTRQPFTATYRIQLSKDFTFGDLLAQVDYLHELGISHLYLSPVLASVSGSNHGYDGTDFMSVSEERGGEGGLAALDEKLRGMNPPMAMILDIVPNHMAASTENKYWRDVLEKGRASEFWSLFDMRGAAGEKIRLPVLGQPLDELIQQKEIKLEQKKDTFFVCYGGADYPLRPETQEKLRGLHTAVDADIRTILAEQNYELAYWREASDTVSYRRFFDIAGLVGLKVEDPAVYKKTHQKIFQLIADMPSIVGVRVDHIDGLVDPADYLQRLARDVPQVWVEKILAPDEDLPAEWPIAGTSGYEFIDCLNPVLVDTDGFAAVEGYWRENVCGEWRDFADAVTQAKTQVLQQLFAVEWQRLVTLSHDEGARLLWQLLTIHLQVYRTYYDGTALSATDRDRVMQAVDKAEAVQPGFQEMIAPFLADILDPQTDGQKQALREWQQLSGPVMAKGLEDTAHYRYTPLAGLNEVGSGPHIAAFGFAGFANALNHRAKMHPQTMKTTSTHDTKRSEDARHRLFALADMPGQWRKYYEQVLALTPDGPGDDVVYFILQAILAAWPLDGMLDEVFETRLWAYLEKSLREAKQKTSSFQQDEAYENQVREYAAHLAKSSGFLELTRPFVAHLNKCGAMNSLAALTIKILSPGVPDIYQGNEAWDFSLVDPDNRRPVDFDRHRQVLAELPTGPGALGYLLEHWQDGGIKLWLTQKLLAIRKECTLPLGDEIRIFPAEVNGPMARHVVAYRLATPDEDGLLVLALRFPHALLDEGRSGLNYTLDMRETLLDAQINGSAVDLISGKIVTGDEQAIELLEAFPIAVLRSGVL